MFLVCVSIGCGRGAAPSASSAAPPAPRPPADPAAVLFENMRTANNDIDVALGDLEEGMKKAKALAPVAGGDAGKALNNVATFLNSGGEALSDCDDPAASLDEFKKDFSAQDENRLKSIDAAIGALQQVDSANFVLDDLADSVPPDKKAALEEIANDADEAQDDLRAAVKLMGGTVPADVDAGGGDS